MPVGVLVLVVVITAAGGYWAWRYQYQVLDLVHRTGLPAEAAVADDHAASDLLAEASPAPASTSLGAAVVASVFPEGHRVGPTTTEATPSPSRSVLGWSRFTVVSVVTIDGTAIVACRAAEEDPDPCRRHRLRGRRATPASGPLLLATDQTVLLRMGEGPMAERGGDLLERWRQDITVLWLRPTAVAGAIEFFDGHRAALRAVLLAD